MREEAIQECLRGGDVATLLTQLGWPTEDVALRGAVWRAWGWFGPPPRGRLLSQTPGCRVVRVDGAFNRKLVTDVGRRAPLDRVLWFFVDDATVTLAVMVWGEDGAPRVRTMAIERHTPAPVAVQRLRMLDRECFARGEVDPADATQRHLEEVLDHEALTRDFFAKFSAALHTLSGTMRHGPPSEEARWQAALTVLLRLIFIYILQRERLLDADPRYVARRLRRCVSRGEPFYETTLRPLFFGVLNTPPHLRDAVARDLGDVPFLNGGLFEPTPLEQHHRDIHWPTDVLSGVIEGVFEHFHFTAAEPSRADQSCVVDPEMLGKVFEGLMYGDSRKASGAFYTPRHIVSAMVERVLDDYVADRRGDGLDEATALTEVRILDPAVGTGAFLLEALASLRRRRVALGLPDGYATVRQLVHDHLFGVDRNRTAVRLCELRLWLAMLATFREIDGPIDPLPNLSHRIVAGDSLLDEVAALRKRTRPVVGALLTETREREHDLEAAHRVLLDAHGATKPAARARVDEAERALHAVLLRGRATRLAQQVAPLQALAASRDLFGDCALNATQSAQLEALQQEQRAVTERLEQLAERDDLVTGFAYETRFGAVAREGFDIILTNPPWVRAQRVDAPTRAAFTTRYQTASGQLWAGAAALGIQTPYGAQPDLAALFVERSLELLRPGGRLAAIVPAKLFRALHAAPMRRLLAEHRVEQIEDLSDADQQLFDATTYPGIIHVQKDRPANDVVRARVWRGAQAHDGTCGLLDTAAAPGAPWLLAPLDVQRALAEVAERSVALGSLPATTPRRGIFTGANDLFVRPTGGWRAELGDDVAPFVRPLLRGSGLGELPTTEILWCYDGTTALPQLPPALHAHFERHRAALTRRSDYRPDEPLWQLFRVRADEQRPRVAWRDMSVLLDPVVVAPGPVAANTVYYVPFDELDDALGFARWMRSLPVRAAAYSMAERARGGWRRHFAWVIRMLPVPRNLDRWARFDEARYMPMSSGSRDALQAWLAGTAGQRAAA